MEKQLKKEISDRIKLLRNKLGLTQEEVAEKVGLTYNAYVKMENAYNLPSLKVLINLSDVLDVSIDLIVFGNIDKAKADVNDYDKLDNILKLCDFEKLNYSKDFISMISKLDKSKNNN